MKESDAEDDRRLKSRFHQDKRTIQTAWLRHHMEAYKDGQQYFPEVEQCFERRIDIDGLDMRDAATRFRGR